MTVSLNFWFDPRNETMATQSTQNATTSINQENNQQNTNETDKVNPQEKQNFTPTEELVLKREIESMIYETTRDHRKVRQGAQQSVCPTRGHGRGILLAVATTSIASPWGWVTVEHGL